MADPLTARQLRWLRDTVGDTVELAELQSRFDDLESVRDVAIAVLRDRRRAYLDSSLKVSVSGVASVDNTENVKAIEREIAQLVKLDHDPTDEPGEEATAAVQRAETFQLVRSRRR